MKAMQLFIPQVVEAAPLAAMDLPVPEPQASQVLVRVSVCGVCHTDLHTVEGELTPPSYPITPGHQVVGVIEYVGSAVSGWQPGQRVGLPWLGSTCGVCKYCQTGQENLCPQARFTGLHTNGGYAQYCLAQADFLLPLPDTIDDLQAAPLLCAGIIGYRSLKLAGVTPGCRLGLFGFGASAHLAIQVARFWGCEVFIFTRSSGHRQHARELGAAWTGGAEDHPPHLLDCAVSFAPAGQLVPLILEKLRPGGTLALNAVYLSDIPTFPYPLLYGERTLRSVANATRQDGYEFLKLAAEIPLKSTVVTYPLNQANQALLDLKHSRFNGEAVLQIP
ncbi:MAG: zinc-dependent alcohol dehydrogenase family protein [Anaerolineaceae bacterium]|nr:zinc-dependent alcohol dehydrogenase family protein [Anaerolineaceae bacterium]